MDENFGDLTTFQIILAIFLLRMRRNSYFSASSYNYNNAIGYTIQRLRFPVKDGNFGNRKAFTAVLGHFSLRMRRIGIIYDSRPKPFITFVLSNIDFL